MGSVDVIITKDRHQNISKLFFTYFNMDAVLRDLETEISRFEQICAELSNIKHEYDWENVNRIDTQKPQLKPKPIIKKERPKVPPKPKLVSTLTRLAPSEESPEGTEV